MTIHFQQECVFDTYPVCSMCVWSRPIVGQDCWNDQFYLTVGCKRSRVRKDGADCLLTDDMRYQYQALFNRQLNAQITEKAEEWATR